MQSKTKVQKLTNTLSTSLPRYVRDMLDLEKGDTLIWEIDFKEETVTLKKE